MKTTMIKDKLEEFEYPVEEFNLGEFDYIGEFTAKKQRDPNSELFKNVGAFFRPNYERGLLIYSMIRKFKIESYLEIGFGRGYSCMCAAKAMFDSGINGKVTSIEPNIDKEMIQKLGQVLPTTWFNHIEIIRGLSDSAFVELGDRQFEMIYIDGDHRQEQVKRDWENSKDRFTKFCLFDDYHLPTKSESDIEVSKVVDEIDLEKELIIMDRRIFVDDRLWTNEQIDYGQVLIKNPDFDTTEYLMDW